MFKFLKFFGLRNVQLQLELRMYLQSVSAATNRPVLEAVEFAILLSETQSKIQSKVLVSLSKSLKL